jgi:O-antigen/teichoic acid export membrane protein
MSMGRGAYGTTAWALSDQAIISGGNFLTNLVLIRTLAPSSYGAYALILNTVLFLNSLHINMVAYPVWLLGAQSDGGGLRDIATGGLLATLIGSVGSAVLLAAACLSIHRPLLISITIGATVFWQLQEALRATFLCRLDYKRVLAGDSVSYLGQAAVTAAICWHNIPTLSTVFAVILGTSLLAGMGQAMQIRPTLPGRVMIRSFLAELWRIGKWSMLARAVAFFTSQAFPWLLAYSTGFATVASFQSLLQLVALSNPLMLGMNNLIIASIAGQNKSPEPDWWGFAVKQMRLAAVLLGSYFTALACFGYFFMRIIYGKDSPYLLNAPLLRYLAVAYALETIAMFANAILGGLGETRLSFTAQVCAMLTSVLIVFPWIMHAGLTAAVIGLIGVAGTRATAAWYLLLRCLEKQRSLRLTVVRTAT